MTLAITEIISTFAPKLFDNLGGLHESESLKRESGVNPEQFPLL